jgi:hypothetical protein
MKRKVESPHPVMNIDIRKDVSKEQLIGIGAVCLEWNRVERSLDWALLRALDLPWETWPELASRINGIDGKIAILKSAPRQYPPAMDKGDAVLIADTLGAVEEHKRYRDAIMHANLFDPDIPIGLTWQRRGQIFEVLLSADALDSLCGRLCLLHKETACVVQMFHFNLLRHGYYRFNTFECSQQQAEQSFQEYRARLLDLQTQRRSLRPLPKFPDEVRAG